MEEIAISKFKATCLAVLEQVRVTGKPIRVTRFGKPVAEVLPATLEKKKKRILGSMVGTGRIVGDILAPLYTDDELAQFQREREKWHR